MSEHTPSEDTAEVGGMHLSVWVNQDYQKLGKGEEGAFPEPEKGFYFREHSLLTWILGFQLQIYRTIHCCQGIPVCGSFSIGPQSQCSQSLTASSHLVLEAFHCSGIQSALPQNRLR